MLPGGCRLLWIKNTYEVASVLSLGLLPSPFLPPKLHSSVLLCAPAVRDKTERDKTGQDSTDQDQKVNPAVHRGQQCFHSGTVLCSVMSDQSDHSSTCS